MKGKQAVFSICIIALLVASYALVQTDRTDDSTGDKDNDLAKWTVIFYFCGDSNLADYNQMLFNLECLERVGSSDDVNMICLLDRNEGNDTHIYYIEEGKHTEFPLSVVNETWGDELNLGDPNTLVEFSSWCIDEYPAEEYNLMLSNHGGGWMGICWDEADHTGNDNLRLSEISWATTQIKERMGQNISVLSTEACLVGTVEFAHAIYPNADFFVGGETYGYGGENTTEGGVLVGNWQFETTYGRLIESPEMTPEQLATSMVTDFVVYGPWTAPPDIPKTQSSDCMSAMNLSALPALVKATDDMAKEMMGHTRTGLGRERLTMSVVNSESFSGQYDFLSQGVFTNYDLYCLAEQTSSLFPGDSGLQDTCNEVKACIDDVIVIETHGNDESTGEHPNAHGIAIYFPLRADDYYQQYEDTPYAQETQWDEMMRDYWRINT